MIPSAQPKPPRPKAVLLALLVLPLLVVLVFAASNRIWWARGERAISEAVRATAAGQPPATIALTVDSVLNHPAVRRELAEAYTTTSADNFLAGSDLAAIVDPGVLVAHLQFPSGRAVHAEAWHENGRWHVRLEPAEDAASSNAPEGPSGGDGATDGA